MTTIKALLGTDNRKAQIEQIEALLRIARTPVTDLVIRYDAQTDEVTMTVIGGDVAFDTIFRMLELTGKAVRQSQNVAYANQAAQANEEEVEE